MQSTVITRIPVWSRWLRISHWIIAISTLGLLGTGFLMRQQFIVSIMVQETHYIFSSLLLPALLIRLYLLFFGKGTDLINDCEPNSHRLSQAWEVVKFYLTLGKTQLPKWFSHNPLWGPIYLAILFILSLCIASGFALLNEVFLFHQISMIDLHLFTYQVIGVFTLLHLLAVFAHDTGSTGSDISGMINGCRIFEVKQETHKQEIQAVGLEDLLKTLKPKKIS